MEFENDFSLKEWAKDKPLSILQLDPADRAVLRIADTSLNPYVTSIKICQDGVSSVYRKLYSSVMFNVCTSITSYIQNIDNTYRPSGLIFIASGLKY
ncbi:unnamed protein product [Danaus chrysippus]|uniref:(African queen) hypothetical protein n=1 Tax=Danaus chrysippus TaxID=151541 RepID=A0A8J2VWW2_9NEOP|nr:unnamed protein product [Danaus chrysippus]